MLKYEKPSLTMKIFVRDIISTSGETDPSEVSDNIKDIKDWDNAEV